MGGLVAGRLPVNSGLPFWVYILAAHKITWWKWGALKKMLSPQQAGLTSRLSGEWYLSTSY